jgi:hypothetical protein
MENKIGEKYRDIKISNILPKQMVGAFITNPPVHAQEIVDKHYVGLWIQTSGTVESVDLMTTYITFNFDDSDGIFISANFSKPIDDEVSVLNKGDKINLVGQVFNVGGRIVVLDNCELVSEKKSQTSRIEPIKSKWWERTWVQVIFLLGAIAGILALLLI